MFLCRYHGHHCIVKGAQRLKTYVHQSGKTAEELYQATLQREEQLRSLGYKVVSIFECEFRKQMAENEEIKNFVDTLSIEERLDPRDAFLGNFQFFFQVYYIMCITSTKKMMYLYK